MPVRPVFMYMFIAVVCSACILLFFSVHADGATATFHNPLKYDSFKGFLFALIDGLTIVLMPVIVFLIAYIGFRMVLAGREKNADYTRWKSAFAMALIGLFLVLGARGVLYVIQNTVTDVLGDEYVEDLLGE